MLFSDVYKIAQRIWLPRTLIGLAALVVWVILPESQNRERLVYVLLIYLVGLAGELEFRSRR